MKRTRTWKKYMTEEKKKDHHNKIFELQAAWDSVKEIQGAETIGGWNLCKRRLQWLYRLEKDKWD